MPLQFTFSFSAQQFKQEFRRFAAFVEKEQKGAAFDSFLRGYAWDTEFYKTEIHREALLRLRPQSWTEDDIGSGRILQCVIDAIEISEKDLRNNLVNWEGKRYGEDSCTHLSLYEARDGGKNRTVYEAAFFDFYRGNIDPEEAMEQFIRFGGRRYDFLAYLFFLRDWERFMPIAPKYFQAGFERLGLLFEGEPLRLRGNASWENYSAYNAALQIVRDALRGEGIEHVRLIDAHSFVFILAHSVKADGPLRPVSTTEENDPERPSPGAPLIDWEKWAAACRLNGKLAEEFIQKLERRRLEDGGRPDLLSSVRIVSDDHTLGYDIRSVELDGTARYLEVKSARREDGDASFYVTENEWQRSRQLTNYWFCLVFGVRGDSPEVEYVRGTDFADKWLTPVAHAARMPGSLRSIADC